MTVSEAHNTVIPSALAGRMVELYEQSRRHQSELTRITAEIEELQRHIAALAPKQVPDLDAQVA